MNRAIKILSDFNGYCPECELNGEIVEMRLNTMDFYESEKTGLQISAFPPYAAILAWRGDGKFRHGRELASDVLFGYKLTSADKREGKEIFPDEKKVLETTNDLKKCIQGVFENYEAFKHSHAVHAKRNNT